MANSKYTPANVAANVRFLREAANLTLEGFISAIGISLTYLRKIEKGEANITTELADKIADFFEIKTESILSAKGIKLKPLEEILPLQKFYKENKNNSKFFIDRKGENSVAHFLKNTLLPTGYFLKGYEVSEIQTYIRNNYNKDFSSKELSRELNRLVEKKKLFRKDLFGNQSIFSYSEIQL